MWSIPQIVDYTALCHCIGGLRSAYPFLRTQIIGRSHTGRSLFALSIGEGEKCVLFSAGYHGSEWLTELLLLRFAECICHGIQTNSPAAGIDFVPFLARREIIIMPCVNPDGTEIFLHGAKAAGALAPLVERHWDKNILWNANAHGVDINHNFDAGWALLHKAEEEQGICAPAPRQYGGAFPESEPETKAICDLCRRKNPLHALAIHSQGEEIFWKYGKENPPGAQRLKAVFTAVSGYKAVRNAGLYAHGGFKDWFIQAFHRPAFTIEMGKGENPLPLSDFETIFARLQDLLILAAVL